MPENDKVDYETLCQMYDELYRKYVDICERHKETCEVCRKACEDRKEICDKLEGAYNAFSELDSDYSLLTEQFSAQQHYFWGFIARLSWKYGFNTEYELAEYGAARRGAAS